MSTFTQPSRAGSDWEAFHDNTRDQAPHITTAFALSRFDEQPRGRRLALDLGCGAGRDTRALLSAGFHVTAVDVATKAIYPLVQSLVRVDRMRRLRVVRERFEQFHPYGSFDFVNASLALPFCTPDAFGPFVERVIAVVAANGRFAGHFFGPKDDWAPSQEQTFLERSAVEALFVGFELELFRETEIEDVDALGRPKHWHIFGVVARRRAKEGHR